MPQTETTTPTPGAQDAEIIATAELIDRVRDFINSAECSTREQVGLDLVAMLGIAEAKLLSAPVTSPRVAALQLEKGLVASFHDGERTDRLDITSALGVMAWLHDQANAQAGGPASGAAPADYRAQVEALEAAINTPMADDSDTSIDAWSNAVVAAAEPILTGECNDLNDVRAMLHVALHPRVFDGELTMPTPAFYAALSEIARFLGVRWS